MMDWQPIETVPKDGNTVLLCANGVVLVGRWVDESPWEDHHEPGWIGQYDGATSFIVPPTHWQPLPAPPGSSHPTTREQCARIVEAFSNGDTTRDTLLREVAAAIRDGAVDS